MLRHCEISLVGDRQPDRMRKIPFYATLKTGQVLLSSPRQLIWIRLRFSTILLHFESVGACETTGHGEEHRRSRLHSQAVHRVPASVRATQKIHSRPLIRKPAQTDRRDLGYRARIHSRGWCVWCCTDRAATANACRPEPVHSQPGPRREGDQQAQRYRL